MEAFTGSSHLDHLFRQLRDEPFAWPRTRRCVLRFPITRHRLPAQQRVLIVDPSDDSREVLRTMLERRGVEIYDTATVESGLSLARECHPDVMVVDTDEESADCADLGDQAKRDNAYLVLLTSIRMAAPGQPSDGQTQVVAKPYHYGPLLRKIEALLSKPPASFKK